MNISQILQEGSGVVLNNVEVIKDYGQKSGKVPHRAVHCKDSSGATMVKLWGPASNNSFQPGEVFTVQAAGNDGNISVSEWQGKYSLNCNDCDIIRAAAPATSQDAPPPQTTTGGGARVTTAPAASSGHHDAQPLTPEQLSNEQVAHFRRVLAQIGPIAEEIGADPSSAMMAAAHMTGSADGWWFGAKYPGMFEG